jgi:predicted secreted protein
MAATLYEPGEITLDIAYAPAGSTHDAMTSAMLGATDYDWKVTFSDTTTYVAASGFVTAFEPSADLDGQLTASITIKLNGALTITGA